MKILITIIITLSLTSCTHRQQISPNMTANAGNSFDQSAYQSLMSAGTIIEQTKIELSTSETYPTPIAIGVRNALAYAIDSFHLAQHAYMDFHKLALMGQDTQAEYDNLASALHDLSLKLAILASAKSGKES